LLQSRRVVLDDEDDEEKGGGPKVGTKRSKNYYSIVQPSPFNSLPAKKLHVYKIVSTLVDPISEADRQRKRYTLYRPEEHERKLGLVFGAEMPIAGMSEFHLHTLSGRVKVRLEKCGIIPNFTEEKNVCVRKFSELIFGTDGLALTPPWMAVAVAAGSAAKEDYMVVPMIREKIDFEFMIEVIGMVRKQII
jgi:hypothetical protein